MFESANIFDAAVSDKEKAGETAPESSTETEQPAGQGEGTEGTPKDLKPGEALHKDERFRRVIADRNRLRQEREEMLSRLQALESRTARQESPKTDNRPMPAVFASYFGTEAQAQEAWNLLKPLDKDALKAELREELQNERQSEAQEAQKWDRWVADNIESLRDEGEEFDKNALLKVMDEYGTKDAEGNYDFRKGLELLRRLEATQPNPVEAKRKAGALATATKTGSAPDKKNYVTPSDIKKWRLNGTL
jgi:hypothetical protein